MTRKIALLPILFVLLTTLAACDTAEERAEKHYQAALALIEEGDFARANVEFRSVFKLNASHREARRSFAEMHYTRGNVNAAFRHYLQLVEQYPDDGPALLRIADFAIQANQWDQAERYGARATEVMAGDPSLAPIQTVLAYRQAILTADANGRKIAAESAEEILAAAPNTIILNQVLLDWYTFEGREPEALEQVDQAIAQSPGNLAFYQARLGILNALGETPEIERQLREMAQMFPDNLNVRQMLFSWLMQQGDVESAETFLRDLAENASDDDRESARVALIQFIRSNEGPDAAIAEIEKILASGTDNVLFGALRAGIIFDGGERDQAISDLESVLSGAGQSPQADNAKVVLARMHLSTGNMVGGRALIEEVLASDNSHVEALKIKSRLLIDGDKASEAIVLLRSAEEQAPDDAEVYSLTAQAHERNGNRDLMGDMLARAAEVSNRGPAESQRLATFLASRRQFAPAEQALIESLRNNANNEQLLAQLGRIYLQMEKLAEADAIQKTLEKLGTDTSSGAASGLRLNILQAQNRSDDMVALIQDLNDGASNQTRAVVAIMRTHLLNGNFEKAREVIDEGIANDTENLDLRYASAVLHASRGNLDAARKQMRSVLDAQPLAVNVWLSLARTHASAGDAKGAEAIVDEALVAVPEGGNIQWAKAGYLEARGDIGGAIDIYEDLYDARSSSVVAANNLASLLTSYRETPETIERAYGIARRLRGIEQPAFQDTYGWIAFLRGDLDDALAHLEPSATGLPNDPLVQYHLARVYEALGRHQDAVIAYQRAITILGDGENVAMSDAAERLASATAAAAATDN